MRFMPTAASIRCFEADLSREAHRRAVADLVNMYAREPLARGSDLPADVLASLPEFLRTFPTTHVFLAQLEGGIDDDLASFAGIAVCLRSISTFAAAPAMNIHDIAVRPTHRGKGVGKALLAEVQRAAHRLGCSKMTLEVHHENVGAIAAYRNFGFADGVKTAAAGEIWFFEKRL